MNSTLLLPLVIDLVLYHWSSVVLFDLQSALNANSLVELFAVCLRIAICLRFTKFYQLVYEAHSTLNTISYTFSITVLLHCSCICEFNV